MHYHPFPITGRMEALKTLYKGLPVPREADPYHPSKYKAYRSGDRLMTLGYLRGFYNHSNADTTRLRTSYAEAQELYEAKPVILDQELLLGHLYLPEYTPEEQAEYDRLCDSFAMSSHTLLMRPPRKDHLGLDFEKLLRVGVGGLKSEIRDALAALDMGDENLYPDFDALRKYEFYQCCLIELDAVSDLAARYSAAALALAEKESEPRSSELRKMGQMLLHVPEKPARTFYEAVQSVHFFLSTLFGLYPLGRPDRYLYPYYKQDLESGAITKEFAQDLVDNFCLGVSDRVFSRSACGFIVGGYDRNGQLVENDLTYMFITALDHLKLPDPNGALAVNHETSNELLAYCAEILSRGVSHPAFYNDEVIINSLANNYGVSRADAADYIHATCAEITVVGKSKGHSTPFALDLPKLLLDTVKEDTYEDLDSLLDAYYQRIHLRTREYARQYGIRILEGARIGNEAMRACTLVDDCIARGKSIYEGGERYTFLQPIFIGFATTVDCLVALSRLVFEDKQLTMEAFIAIVESDFAENEMLRQYIIRKLPHYGNNDPTADGIAKELAKGLQQVCVKKDVPLWPQMMPGTFSYVNHATHGSKLGATFDGRRAGYAYSDGCSAAQGRDVNGPTSMILSLTSWDQGALLGGMVVNIKFGVNVLCREKVNNFIGLLRSFLERGGIELQVNVVDRETLEDARIHPEDHRDLIVRIGGYSDYFTRLNPTLQQEIIDRTQC